MAKLRFTKVDARKTFDKLSKRVSQDELSGIEEWRLAVIQTGNNKYGYNWQNLPTPNVKGWINGITAKDFYTEDGKRKPIGASVDYLYNKVNQVLGGQQKPAATQLPTSQSASKSNDGDTQLEREFKEHVHRVAQGIDGQGPQKTRAVIQYLQSEAKYRGSWGQMGRKLAYRPLNNANNTEIVVEVQ